MKEPDSLMADAIFEGGGGKGIGLVGAVAVAEERGYQWVNVDVTSAGAIVAAILAAGHSVAEYVDKYRSDKHQLEKSLRLRSGLLQSG